LTKYYLLRKYHVNINVELPFTQSEQWFTQDETRKSAVLAGIHAPEMEYFGP